MRKTNSAKYKEANNNKLSAILAGVSGEYFVAAELSRRGYIASITLKNTKGIDILVTNENATKTIGIQVKTNQTNKRAWILNKKAETFYADDLFYIFVNLHCIERQPEYYIVPSKIVAETIKKNHQNWLNSKGKYGQSHNDSPVRIFEDKGSIPKSVYEEVIFHCKNNELC